MDIVNIEYRLSSNQGQTVVFNLVMDTKSLEFVHSPQNSLPSWTKLEFHKCSHCPLSSDQHSHCPVAVNLVGIVDCFDEVMSYTDIDMEVITAERLVRQKTSAQQALSSLMGLLIGASGCPHTAFFKSMARHHLPLASQEETIYRATSMYLLAQYFTKKDNKPTDLNFDGLQTIYQNMEIINTAIAKRLRAASTADSSVNAIVLLDLHAKTLPLFLDSSLEKIRYLFEPFMQSLENKDHTQA